MDRLAVHQPLDQMGKKAVAAARMYRNKVGSMTIPSHIVPCLSTYINLKQQAVPHNMEQSFYSYNDRSPFVLPLNHPLTPSVCSVTTPISVNGKVSHCDKRTSACSLRPSAAVCNPPTFQAYLTACSPANALNARCRVIYWRRLAPTPAAAQILVFRVPDHH